jgi:hypothetical protein
MFQANRQNLNAIGSDLLRNKVSQRQAQTQFAKLHLDLNLPKTHDTDNQGIFRDLSILYGR